MLITQVYAKYKITQMLQLHQLKVAAVAKQVCDSLTVPVDTNSVIKACLLHDMGNVLKFDFTYDPKFFEPQGVEYWKAVREEVVQKYQTQDEHLASIKIAQELGMNHTVIKCIKFIDFGRAVENSKSDQLEPKICDNADMRVGPRGILSVRQRMDEGRKRYKDRPDKWIMPQKQELLSKACYKIQTQVFKNSQIKPSDITEESIKPIIQQLRSYEI